MVESAARLENKNLEGGNSAGEIEGGTSLRVAPEMMSLTSEDRLKHFAAVVKSSLCITLLAIL